MELAGEIAYKSRAVRGDPVLCLNFKNNNILKAITVKVNKLFKLTF